MRPNFSVDYILIQERKTFQTDRVSEDRFRDRSRGPSSPGWDGPLQHCCMETVVSEPQSAGRLTPMKRALFAAAAVSGLAAASLLAAPVGLAADTPNATPQHVDDFQLTDQTRLAQHLYYFGYTPAIVIMTRSNGTPVSKEASAALEKLNAAYKDKGVVVWGLDSNLANSRDAVAAEAAKQNLSVPILMDEQQLVGEQLGVQREGEVFVINPKTWTVAYRGPMDAHAGAAVDALLAGAKPTVTRVSDTVGKPVAFPEKAHAAEFADISYSKTVAPILQAKCVSCHVNGGIGPFAMNSCAGSTGFGS